MRKLLLLLVMTVIFNVSKAQTSITDYIYCSEGFEVKTGDISYSDKDITSKGLYTKDGKCLVYAISGTAINSYNSRFFVLEGCETICSGAFQGFTNCFIYIPSSVKCIAPDAFRSNILGGIIDGCKDNNPSRLMPNDELKSEAVEVARYNLQGIRLSEPTNGVNIVRKSDGTSEKFLINQ